MKEDSIVAEVRAAREAQAARLGYDIAAICANLKRLENRSQHKKISSLPRLPKASGGRAQSRQLSASNTQRRASGL